MRRFLLAFTLFACSQAKPLPSAAPRPVPVQLQPPAGSVFLLAASARGVQIYERKSGASAGTLKAPEAELFDDGGAKIGRHFGGPTWQLTNGSQVVGKVKEKLPGEPGSIPWLLLQRKSGSGEGKLARAAFIQRVDTQGGPARAEGCDPAHPGAESRIEYTASYLFYGAKP